MLGSIYYLSNAISILYAVTNFILAPASGYSISIMHTRTSLQNLGKLAGSHSELEIV